MSYNIKPMLYTLCSGFTVLFVFSISYDDVFYQIIKFYLNTYIT